MRINRDSICFLILQKIHMMKLDYCIARNYEQFPKIGNDLDIFFEGPLNKLITLIDEICEKYNWNYFFNNKWSEGKYHIAETKVYCFFLFFKNGDFFDYVQIDFFNGFCFLGQPIFSASEIIKKHSIFDENISFYRINDQFGGIIAAFQIEGLGRNKKIRKKNTLKISKYLKKFNSAFDIKKYDNFIFNKFKISKLNISKLHKLSVKNDQDKFCKLISQIKFLILVNLFKANPILFSIRILNRLIFLINIYSFQSPGLVIKEDIKYENLFKENYFPLIKKIPNKFVALTPKSRKFLERNGILVISKYKFKDKTKVYNEKIKAERKYFYECILKAYAKKLHINNI